MIAKLLSATREYLIWAAGAMAASASAFFLIGLTARYPVVGSVISLIIATMVGTLWLRPHYFRFAQGLSASYVPSIFLAHFKSNEQKELALALRVTGALVSTQANAWLTNTDRAWIVVTWDSSAFLANAQGFENSDAFLNLSCDSIVKRIRFHQPELRSDGIEHMYVHCPDHRSFISRNEHIVAVVFQCKSITFRAHHFDISSCGSMLGRIIGIHKAPTSIKIIGGPLQQIEGLEAIDAF
jgi:hypothetical protein